MKEATIKAVTAMGCVTVLVVAALSQGIDGVVLGTGLGILSALGGYYSGKKA